MYKHYKRVILTNNDYDVCRLGETVKEIVAEAGVTTGMATIITAHTNNSIIVTEPLDCILSDLDEHLLRKLVLDDAQYSHAHFLPTYGRTSANATGHLRSILCGNHCHFPIDNGKLLLGDAQEIFLLEFDGPQARTVFITIEGE